MLGLDVSMLQKGISEELWYVSLGDYIIDLAWSPSYDRLAAVTVEGSVVLIEDHADAATFRVLGSHAGGANSVSWRHDGGEFATAGQDGLVKIWNGHSGDLQTELDAGDNWVAKVAYSPRRSILASGAGRHLKLWTDQRTVLYESSDHESTISDLVWSPKESEVAVAAYQGVTLHVPGKEEKPRKYKWKGSSLVLAWSPDAKYIATGEQDSTVHFWHMKSGDDAQMNGFPTKVLELSWHSSGYWLAAGGGSTITLWDCSGRGPEGRTPKILEAHVTKITQLAFQPQAAYLASADLDNFLFLWIPLVHDKLIGGQSLSSPATCLRWAPDGRLAVGQRDGNIVVFKIQSLNIQLPKKGIR